MLFILGYNSRILVSVVRVLMTKCHPFLGCKRRNNDKMLLFWFVGSISAGVSSSGSFPVKQLVTESFPFRRYIEGVQ